MPENMENSTVATRLETVSFHFNPKERLCQRMFKLLHNCTYSNVMVKTHQARLQQYINGELQDVKPGFRKGRGTRDQIANILGSQKMLENSRKNIYFSFIDYAKAFDCVAHKLREILKKMGTLHHLTCLL